MTASDPLVSVIIPSHNYARFLREALDSVLTQTHRNLEIVVVDDGSTDGSADIARGYADRVRLIERQNMGVVAARNLGFSESRGAYIAFLDADDRIEPRFIERLLHALQSADPRTAFAYCDVRTFGAMDVRVPGCDWNPRKLLYRNYIVVSALIRRAAFEAVGGYSPPEQNEYSFEDWDLWLTLLEAGFSGVYVPEELHSYRVHDMGRNRLSLAHDAELRRQLRRRHARLYRRLDNAAYVMVRRALGRLLKAVRPSMRAIRR